MPSTIILEANGVKIPATLNDTVAAMDFKKRIPFTVSGYRSEVDYCCTAAIGRYDPTETQNGWKNGDISIARGWFAIFFDGEKQSKSFSGLMIIAHIDEKNIHLVKELPENVRFTVSMGWKENLNNKVKQ